MTGISALPGITGPTLAIGASASPPFVTAYGNSGASADLTTGASTVVPKGGLAPYTYAWSQVGTSPYTWSIGSATAATTTFTATGIPAGVETVALFQCVITDSTGAKATVQVEADANNGQPYSSYTPSGGSGSGITKQGGSIA